MLSDREIEKLVKEGKIVINPFSKKSLRASKYEIHLGRYLLKPKNTESIIDLSDSRIQPEYEKIDIIDKPYILKPGEFLLGQTLELFGLDPDIGMFLDGSSTPARLGITVHQSAMFLPPGQNPHIITLEFFNAGPWRVKLTNKLRIGKVIIFQSSKKNRIPEKTFNRYDGQKETTGAIIKKNNRD